jgi:hypothetical protein
MRLAVRARRAALLLTPIALTITLVAPTHTGAAAYTTVISGLRNPRGLAVNSAGTLFVAEAGEGGSLCFAGVLSEEGNPTCGGRSGRISRVTAAGVRSDYAKGFISVDGPIGAIGVTGVVVKGHDLYGLVGLNDKTVPPTATCGGGPACRSFVATATAQAGHLFRVGPWGYVKWRQDVGAVNYQWTVDHKATIGKGNAAYQPGYAKNPDFTPGDANPYGLASAWNGNYVVDGGSNTLTWVPKVGTPRVLAALPNPPKAHQNAYDSVPTCVAPTEQGVVVADLNGQMFLVKPSSNLTVKPKKFTSVGGAFLVSAGGCVYDNAGNVYVSDIFAGGMVKLSLRTMTMSWVRPPGTFNFPSGMAVKGHTLYVSNNSLCPSFPTPVSKDNPCGGVTGSIASIRV